MSSRRRNLLAFGVLIMLLGFFLLVSSPSVYAAQSQTFAYINITDGWAPSENISVMENNWVELQGGVEVTIPKLTFVYNGFNETNYTKGGRSINITINVDENTDHEVEYPYTKHPFFYNDSTVVIKFDTSLSGTVYYYIAETYPTEVKDIVDEVVDGDTASFRDLFFNHSTSEGMVDLPGGVITIPPEAGDYIMIVTDEQLNKSDFELISATGIEVLEYKSELTAPSSIGQNEDLEVTMNIISAPTTVEYRYGGALIKKEVYEKEREIRLLTSDATKLGTELTIDGVSLIEDWKIAGVGLGNVNASIAREKIEGLIGADNGAVAYRDPTNNISQEITFATIDLPLGTYILSVGVWQGSNKLVAFNQTEIEIAAVVAPPPPPVGGRGGGGGAVAAPKMNVPVDPVTGAVTSTTTLSADGATLTIPEGTIVKDAEGNILSTPIFMLHTPTTAETVGAIKTYEFGPSGMTFEPPIDLVIAYDPADIPEGFSESDLVIRMWDGTAWIDLETIVDTTAHMATAKVSHFSIFALFIAPPVAPVTPTPVVTPSPTTPTATPTPTVPVEEKGIPYWIWGLIATGFVVAVAYLYQSQRKKGKGKK